MTTHGTAACGRRGCPRDECRRALLAHRKRLRIHGQRHPAPERAAEAHRIVVELAQTRTLTDIAADTGIARRCLTELRKGGLEKVTWRTLQALRQARDAGEYTPDALIPKDLTARRVWSMAALGHSLRWQTQQTGVNLAAGRWRSQAYVQAQTAAAIRDLYRQVGDTPAPDGTVARYVRAVARRHGADVPASWDDPGTLAWPDGWDTGTPDLEPVVDEAKVLRAIDGDQAVAAALTPDERVEAVRALNARHWIDSLIARHLGLSAHVVRRARDLGDIPPVPDALRVERTDWEAA